MAVAAPIQDALSKMERRFVTASFIPTALVVFGYAFAVATARSSTEDVLTAWKQMSIASQASVIAGLLLVSWFLAGLLHSNWRKIVRLYEGYPIKSLFLRLFGSPFDPVRWSKVPGVAWHVRVQQSAPPSILYSRYPPRKHRHLTLPTTIGNVLLSGERYALDRYGFDVNLLWPRLFWQLPPEVRQSIEVSKEEHQVPLALSFVGVCFAVLGGGTVFVLGGTWQLFSIVCVIGFSFSVAAYLLAVERTEEYAEQLRVTVDLYRRSLVDNWRPGPRRFNEEQQFFAAASAFVQSGLQLRGGGPDPSMVETVQLSSGTAAPRTTMRKLRWLVESRLVRRLAKGLARRRLLDLGVACMVVWTLGGALLLSVAAGEARPPAPLRVSLPVLPPLPPSEVLRRGEVVDLTVRPCGLRLSEVTVLRTTTATSTQGMPPSPPSTAGSSPSPASGTGVPSTTATFRLTREHTRILEGCPAESATVFRR